MKNVITLSGVALFVLFFLSADVVLAGDQTKTLDLGTVVVSEKKPRLGVMDDAVVGQDDIALPSISRTVDSLFDSKAGIDLQRTSLTGNTGSDVILRGFDESRYLVLLDGRPLNGSGVYGGEYVDWSALSTEDIERVEILRGAKSAAYGNTLGGAINIITKKGTEKPKVDIRSSYGSFNTVDAAISQSGNLGKFLYENFSYGFWRTDGYLRNNHVHRHNFSGRLNFILPYGIGLGIGARYTMEERGFVVENRRTNSNYKSEYPESDEDAGGGPYIQWRGKPGPFGPVDPSKYWGDESYWENKKQQYDVELEKSFGSFDFEARGYLTRQDRTEYFYAIDDSSKLVFKRYTIPDRSGGWLVKGSLPIGKHNLSAGGDGVYLGDGGQEIKYADSAYFRILPTNSDAAKKTRRRHGIFVQDAWQITDSFELDLGLRYDNYWAKETESVFKQGLSPKFGFIYEVWKGFKVTGDFGQAYRFPTSPEFYWYDAGYQPSNRKSLSPERALQGEIGAAQEVGEKGTIGVRGYYYDVNHYIRTIFGYQPSRVVYNIDNVKLWGIEAEGQYAIIDNLSLFANYTYQSSQKDGDILDLSSELTDRLTELPRNKVNAGLRYTLGAFSSEFKMRFVGQRSVITGSLTSAGASELVDLKRFTTFDLNLSYKVLEKEKIKGTVDFAIENIFDKKYEETNGYPMPGATVTGGVTLSF